MQRIIYIEIRSKVKPIKKYSQYQKAAYGLFSKLSQGVWWRPLLVLEWHENKRDEKEKEIVTYFFDKDETL